MNRRSWLKLLSAAEAVVLTAPFVVSAVQAEGESEEAVEISVPSSQEFCDTGDGSTQVDVHEDGSVWCADC